jgi:hypothetical protein
MSIRHTLDALAGLQVTRRIFGVVAVGVDVAEEPAFELVAAPLVRPAVAVLDALAAPAVDTVRIFSPAIGVVNAFDARETPRVAEAGGLLVRAGTVRVLQALDARSGWIAERRGAAAFACPGARGTVASGACRFTVPAAGRRAVVDPNGSGMGASAPTQSDRQAGYP